jgi:hypothetical protein
MGVPPGNAAALEETKQPSPGGSRKGLRILGWVTGFEPATTRATVCFWGHRAGATDEASGAFGPTEQAHTGHSESVG